MDSVKPYTGRLLQGQYRSESQDWYRAEDVEALQSRLGEVERALAHDREQWNLACGDAEEAREQLTIARQELDQCVSWNHRVSVCKDHTADIVDGDCVICALDLARHELAGAYDRAIEACKAQRWRGPLSQLEGAIDAIYALKPTKETAGG